MRKCTHVLGCKHNGAHTPRHPLLLGFGENTVPSNEDAVQIGHSATCRAAKKVGRMKKKRNQQPVSPDYK